MADFQVNDTMYNRSSIGLAEKMILKWSRAISRQRYLWISFQATTLQDVTNTSQKFSDAFRNMQSSFKENGILMTTMTANMRNTRGINEVAKNIQCNVDQFDVSNVLEPGLSKSTHMNTTVPRHIPVQQHDIQQDLGKVMVYALEKVMKNSLTNKCVIIHDKHFESKTLCDKITELVDVDNEANNTNVLVYPQVGVSSEAFIRQFLDGQHNVLIARDIYITGLEAENVIYCSGGDKKDGSPASVRCNLMRAICNLIVVQVLQPTFTGFDFVAAEVDSKFLSCQVKDEMTWHCHTCSFKICSSCLHACHEGHNIQKRKKGGSCMCHNKACTIRK